MIYSQKAVNTFNYSKKHFANFITLFNLSLGFAALIFVLQKDFLISLILILLAALTDRLDGITARKLNIVSAFGKYLDSFSDLVSFGVAPAILIYYSTLLSLKAIGLLAAFIFLLCGVYRLARYNITEFSGYYAGLPITIAGALLASSYLLKNIFPIYVYLGLFLLLSYLMICKIAIKKR